MLNPVNNMDPVSRESVNKTQLGSLLNLEESSLEITQKFMYLKMSEYKGYSVELVRLTFSISYIVQGLIFFKEANRDMFYNLTYMLLREHGDPTYDDDNHISWKFEKGALDLYYSSHTPQGTALDREYIYIYFSKE